MTTGSEIKELRTELSELRTQLTSVQVALSMVLSPEHRKLVNSKDVSKVFKEIVKEMRDDESAQLRQAQETWVGVNTYPGFNTGATLGTNNVAAPDTILGKFR